MGSHLKHTISAKAVALWTSIEVLRGKTVALMPDLSARKSSSERNGRGILMIERDGCLIAQ
jgi:hypothetical protein